MCRRREVRLASLPSSWLVTACREPSARATRLAHPSSAATLSWTVATPQACREEQCLVCLRYVLISCRCLAMLGRVRAREGPQTHEDVHVVVDTVIHSLYLSLSLSPPPFSPALSTSPPPYLSGTQHMTVSPARSVLAGRPVFGAVAVQAPLSPPSTLLLPAVWLWPRPPQQLLCQLPTVLRLLQAY